MRQTIAVDWETLKSEWRERDTKTIRATLVQQKLIPDKSLESLREDLKKREIWLHAFEVDGGATLLAYFVFVWGMQMWELTSEHDEVGRDVAGARTGYLSAYHKARDLVNSSDSSPAAQREKLRDYLSDEQKLVHLIFSRLTIPVKLEASQAEDKIPIEVSGALLLDAMSVESAVYSASTVAAQKRAHAIRKLCEEVLEDALIKDGPDDGIRSLLREVLDAHSEYYGSIEQSAEAMQSAGRAEPYATSLLDAADKKLTKAQDSLGDDIYASELPAYRAALKAWKDRLRTPTPVQLDSVNITYIYPFTLSGIEGEEAQEIIANECGPHPHPKEDGKKSGRKPNPTFGGLSPFEPDEQPLTDMWTWGGRKKQFNATMTLPMPMLTAELADDDAIKSDYTVELRFNFPGNHYLRVDLELENPTLNDINQALRRATTYTGEHDITSGDKKWTTITEYASNVINDVAEWMAEKPKSGKPDGSWARLRHRQPPGESATSETDEQDGYRFNADFDYHIVVVINAASVDDPEEGPRDAKKEEIEETYGSLLLQLLNRETTTLDEWICWGKSRAITNLLGAACFPTDFAMGTESTTVLYMPSTPSWSQSGYEEVAEFAASFPPLMREWKNDLDNQLNSAERMTQTGEDSRIDDQGKKLERLRSGLHGVY